MGNSDLRQVASIEPYSLGDMSGSVVAIDAHNWLYKYLTTVVRWADKEDYTADDGTEVANLIGVVKGLPRFLRQGITPVFVFDGDPNEMKKEEIEERKAKKRKAEKKLEKAINDGRESEVGRLRARTQKITPEIQDTTRELFDRLDIPYVNAPGAGEAQAAYMAKHGVANYVVSDDYDSLLFGSPSTVRRFTGKVDSELMNLEKTLESHSINQEELVDIAILCGTDYNDGIHGVGPKTALKLVRKHRDIHEVIEKKNYSIPQAEEIRRIFLNPDTTENYSISSISDPSLDSARRYITKEWGVPESVVSPDLNRLSQTMFF